MFRKTAEGFFSPPATMPPPLPAVREADDTAASQAPPAEEDGWRQAGVRAANCEAAEGCALSLSLSPYVLHSPSWLAPPPDVITRTAEVITRTAAVLTLTTEVLTLTAEVLTLTTEVLTLTTEVITRTTEV